MPPRTASARDLWTAEPTPAGVHPGATRPVTSREDHCGTPLALEEARPAAVRAAGSFGARTCPHAGAAARDRG